MSRQLIYFSPEFGIRRAKCFNEGANYSVHSISSSLYPDLGSFEKPPSKDIYAGAFAFNDEMAFPVFKPSSNFPHCIYEAKLADLYKVPPPEIERDRNIHVVVRLSPGLLKEAGVNVNVNGDPGPVNSKDAPETVASQATDCSDEKKSQAIGATAVKLVFGQAADLYRNSPDKVCALPANSKVWIWGPHWKL